MLRDDNLFPMPLSHPDTHSNNDAPIPDTPHHINDNFDDVFGSEPPSPSLDAFTADTNHDHRSSAVNGNEEYSDIPRLRSKHTTEGYRDGVTKGKSESVQAGFDEGYSLGAILGLRIGKILGLLEGICSALSVKEGGVGEGEGEEMGKQRVRVGALWEDAKRELGTESVFAREWWGEDGVWKFDVKTEAEGERDVVFTDVAVAHPLVRKWEGIVDQEVRFWGLDLSILDDGDGEEDGGVKGIMGRKSIGPTKEVASENLGAVGTIMGVSKGDLNW